MFFQLISSIKWAPTPITRLVYTLAVSLRGNTRMEIQIVAKLEVLYPIWKESKHKLGEIENLRMKT